MEKNRGNSIIDIPKNALSIQHFINVIKEPVKATFQDQSFIVYGDVDRVTPWHDCYYLTLIEKANHYTYNIKVFISSQVARNDSFEIRPKMKMLVVGTVVLNKNEIQLNAVQYEDLGYSRLHKQIEEWKTAYKPLFERKKKRLPLLCQRIAVISNPAIQGYADFSKHLKYGELSVIETKMQGDKLAEDIADDIKKINTHDRYDCIVIVRGGGSFADLYEFNKPSLLEAIAASMLPVISAVGHETDFPLCDFAADLRFSTPSHAGRELTERVEVLQRCIDDWKQILNTSYFNVLQRYERGIIYKREQIENGLRKALEKDKLRRKNMMVILSAAIIIAILILIIIMLL